MNDCYREGWKAFHEGVPLKANPYHHLSSSLEDEGFWNTGWRDAMGADTDSKFEAQRALKVGEVIAAGQVGAPTEEPSAEHKEWRCFHCDELFTEENLARRHFGITDNAMPACVIKAGAERSLVRALRIAEQSAAEAWNALHLETSDVHKAMYAQSGRHQQALIAAEEAGYERGLADGRNQQGNVDA